MSEIPYPRIVDSSGNILGQIRPARVAISLTITPLSYASVSLPQGENLPSRAFVELFTCMGSAGIYRVRSPHDAYGSDTTTAELEHAIVEVGDYLVLNEYKQMMSATTAIQTIFSHYRGGKWQLGNISAIGTEQVAVDANYDNVLECLLSILDQKPTVMMAFDFSTHPWTLNIVNRDSIVSAECRLSRNASHANIVYDDSELCTRAYYEKPSQVSGSEPTSVWLHKDSDTISTYGIVEKEVKTGSDWSDAEAERAVDEYLSKHKNPRISIDIGAVELSQITGETLDTFAIGKLCRLALSDYNLVVEKTITGLSFQDVYGAPTNITVSLADVEDTAINFLHDVDKKGGSGGGGGGAAKNADDAFKRFSTSIDQNDYYINLHAEELLKDGSILQQAGMYLDPTGVLVYATDNPNMVMAKINTQADRISLVVEGTGANAKIKPAEIVASINDGASTIKLSADHIDMDGIVSALAVVSQTVRIGSLSVFNSLSTPHISDSGEMLRIIGQGFSVNSQIATWQSKTVVTSITRTDSHYFLYAESATAQSPSGSSNGRLVTAVGTETINYLGR